MASMSRQATFDLTGSSKIAFNVRTCFGPMLALIVSPDDTIVKFYDFGWNLPEKALKFWCSWIHGDGCYPAKRPRSGRRDPQRDGERCGVESAGTLHFWGRQAQFEPIFELAKAVGQSLRRHEPSEVTPPRGDGHPRGKKRWPSRQEGGGRQPTATPMVSPWLLAPAEERDPLRGLETA